MQGADLFDGAGGKIIHHFSDGLYAKETRIPAGIVLSQHVHSFDHLSILASGIVEVEIEGQSAQLEGPLCINIEAGKAHKVTALTPVVWYCIHATDEKDAENIDHHLIAS